MLKNNGRVIMTWSEVVLLILCDLYADAIGDSAGPPLQLRSTCHLALDSCERDGLCGRYLDQIKRMCDSINCDRQKCMRVIRDFYANIPEKLSLDIAFCLCK